MTIKGKDVYFYVTAEGGDIMPICCARTASLTTASDIGETSTLGTGTWKTFKGLKNSFTISAGGLISFDMNYSIAKLRQKQVALTPVNFVFFGTDAAGAMERYLGNFIVTSINTPTSYNGNWEYSVEGQGSGELIIDVSGETPFSIYKRFGFYAEDDTANEDRAFDANGFAFNISNAGSIGINSSTGGLEISDIGGPYSAANIILYSTGSISLQNRFYKGQAINQVASTTPITLLTFPALQGRPQRIQVTVNACNSPSPTNAYLSGTKKLTVVRNTGGSASILSGPTDVDATITTGILSAASWSIGVSGNNVVVTGIPIAASNTTWIAFAEIL